VQTRLAGADGDTEMQMNVLRELHHAQLFRLLAQDLEGMLTVERLADHLSALADILVEATIGAVWKTIPNRHRERPLFSVIAYGKLGGKELGYASDLDVIFLYDDEDPEAPALYARLAQRFITWMTSHTPAGILFDIDIALRPDGASGLLVSRVAAFEKYQKESAWAWEHQALTRARFCAGDAEIGQRFESIREAVLRQQRDEAALRRDVLSMRKKLHDAYPNRSDQFDLKHDDGGMIDIEFIVQYLVLRHACTYPQLTADIGNIALLRQCGELGLIHKALAQQVADAYRSFRRLQHQMRLQGVERARVPEDRVKAEVRAVQALWQAVFA
jgi:[glutamine synthetase] adenylyltransferase / [glutamine synthetase]-adenylyl-L-tyrosine phosphorylase